MFPKFKIGGAGVEAEAFACAVFDVCPARQEPQSLAGQSSFEASDDIFRNVRSAWGDNSTSFARPSSGCGRVRIQPAFSSFESRA
jgi:hypothetical protein